MASSQSPVPAAGSRDASQINWERAEHSPEFKELVDKRRKFIVPATIFFLAWYFGFIILAGYAEGFMGESVYEGLTVGYLLALTQFIMVWGLGGLYLRRSDRDFDPLRERAAARALEVVQEEAEAKGLSTAGDRGTAATGTARSPEAADGATTGGAATPGATGIPGEPAPPAPGSIRGGER